jgi:GTPase SAR1 family protein
MDWGRIFEFLGSYVLPAFAFIFLFSLLAELWRKGLVRIFEPIAISHKIAVVGLPGAGKTTLITALFELIQRSDHIPNARLHGLSVVRAVNENVARLNSGKRIGPTTEKDVFVFRFSYLKRRIIFIARSYDVEIADFPGEYSTRISSEDASISNESEGMTELKGGDLEEVFDYTLFRQEFFSWIASSRQYLFLVDLAAIYSSENPRAAIADIIARIRTSWQVIEDSASERGIGSTRARDVQIVFTKLDALVPLAIHEYGVGDLMSPDLNQHTDDRPDGRPDLKTIRSYIEKEGSRIDLSQLNTAERETIVKLIDENDKNFSDLLRFFRSRARKVHKRYCSMIVRDERGDRLGVREVLESVLP